MCKIGLKQHKQTTVTSYYVNAVFDLPSESEYRLTMYSNLDFKTDYPPNEGR